MNVVLRLMKTAVEFVWLGGLLGWNGGVGFAVIFMSNPTTVLRLCCRLGCDNRVTHLETHKFRCVM